MAKGKAGFLGTRLKLAAASAVLALGMIFSGYVIGLGPVAQTAQVYWQARHWQPAQAQVLAAELQQIKAYRGSVYRVQARYRYEFAGRQYEGTRVGLEPSDEADNSSDWHQRWYQQLQGAQSSGTPIDIRVDPRVPSRSLIDPSIRWELQLFRLPFALGFTGAGLVAACTCVATLLGLGRSRKQGGALEAGSAPAALRKGSERGSPAILWIFAFIWCGLCWPAAALAWMNPQSAGWVKAFVSLFAMIGMGMVGSAVCMTFMAWRTRSRSSPRRQPGHGKARASR